MSLGNPTINRTLKDRFMNGDDEYRQMCYLGYEIYSQESFQSSIFQALFHNFTATPEVDGWAMYELLSLMYHKQVYVIFIPLEFSCPVNSHLYLLDNLTKDNEDFSIHTDNSPQGNDGVVVLKKDIMLKELRFNEGAGELGTMTMSAGTNIGFEAGTNTFGKFITALKQYSSLSRLSYEYDILAIFALKDYSLSNEISENMILHNIEEN